MTHADNLDPLSRKRLRCGLIGHAPVAASLVVLAEVTGAPREARAREHQ